jgi:hypothetical protein
MQLTRLGLGVALLALVALPERARPADEKKPTTPGIVVRVQSLDELMNNFRYLATLAGREEQAKQIEGFLKAKAGGPKGFEGIDAKRPWGLYATFGEGGLETSTVVALIPIADEKAFLALIENLGAKAEKDKDGVYEVSSPSLQAPVYFRFAHKHAYATALNKEAIDKDKILAPGAVLPADKVPMLSVTLRIDQIPENVRDLAVQQIKAQLDAAKDEDKAKDTPAEHEVKVQTIDWMKDRIVSVIQDGRELALRIDVDQKAQELSVELGLGGKDGSALAKGIADLGKHKSAVAGLIAPNSVMNFVLNIPPSEQARKAIGLAFEQAFKEEQAKETDKDKKARDEKIFNALKPIGQVIDNDWAVDFRGPGKGGLYTMVAGVKVTDGAVFDKALRNALKEVPAKEREQIKLDVEKAGDVSIHRVEMKDTDEDFKKTFGTGPAYFAVRADAAFVTFGDDALGALKEALKVQPKVGDPLRIEASVSRIAETMAKDKPEAAKAAAKAFAKDKEADKIRLSLEAGKELKVRFTMKTPVITFFHLMEPNAESK